MVGLMTPQDEAQLAQTIEMFEVITQSQPQDYQSLEILKEAYVKLGREQDALNTSKRIARAYVLMGQISSAILEYESILQRFPEDAEVTAALEELENRASNFSPAPTNGEEHGKTAFKVNPARQPQGRVFGPDVDDGRDAMHKLFVEGKIIPAAVFEECWVKPNYALPVTQVVEPFIQRLAEKGVSTVEKSLKLLSDKSRLGYLPLDKYDVDVELARTFPAEVCRRWCILPFDRLSKCLLIATSNPFNRQAPQELEAAKNQRMLWYLAAPADLMRALKKVYR
jgi:tetratricopeptide (TPR) repeat protein